MPSQLPNAETLTPCAANSPSPHIRAGFSLFEVLITITILAVFATLSLKLFEADAAAELQTAGDSIVADLDFARSLAIGNGAPYRVTFDATAGTYFLRHQGTNTAYDVLPKTGFHTVSDSGKQLTCALADIPTLNAPISLSVVRTGTFVVGANSYIEFTALGGTTNSAASVVWLSALTGSNKKYIPVTVNATTGLAYVGEITLTAP